MAFQVEDICSQICDNDIRERIKKLPKSLPETYNRVLSRIVEIGNAEVAKKIFPWVPIARRPMLLEELREAIAVEVLQSYSNPQRLVNDMSQIVSWCGNLIVLDEEDGTIQFTHQTVKTYLLDGFRDQAFADFHFRKPEIDHYAGEICVTYLNFNDFKTKLIKQPKLLPLLTLELILRASLAQGQNSKIMSIWEKVARFRERRRGHTPDSRTILTMDKKFWEKQWSYRGNTRFFFTRPNTGYTIAPPLTKRKHRPGVFGRGYYFWRMDRLRYLGNMMNGYSALGQ